MIEGDAANEAVVYHISGLVGGEAPLCEAEPTDVVTQLQPLAGPAGEGRGKPAPRSGHSRDKPGNQRCRDALGCTEDFARFKGKGNVPGADESGLGSKRRKTAQY